MEYMMVNGYQIPALTLNEPPMPEIGKYGSLRRKFLLENAPMVFDEMLLEGTLYPHLAEMDNVVHRQIEQMMQTLMRQMNGSGKRKKKNRGFGSMPNLPGMGGMGLPKF